ncbi:hypothetical protein J4466_01105 [Candidatus Pacearchaeota archaeon]|nr:hypothetical protein [Candidatus Pacearchaeota archaeon]
MNLNKKKRLAARTLNVGIKRIIFDTSRLDEINEAITKQDIRDLYQGGAIKIAEITGRKAQKKRKTRKREGKIRLKPSKRKEKYVIITRKLRRHLKELKSQGKITNEEFKKHRMQIKMKTFKTKRQLKEVLDK